MNKNENDTTLEISQKYAEIIENINSKLQEILDSKDDRMPNTIICIDFLDKFIKMLNEDKMIKEDDVVFHREKGNRAVTKDGVSKFKSELSDLVNIQIVFKDEIGNVKSAYQKWVSTPSNASDEEKLKCLDTFVSELTVLDYALERQTAPSAGVVFKAGEIGDTEVCVARLSSLQKFYSDLCEEMKDADKEKTTDSWVKPS